jgi:phosphohistidine phosphatase
MISPARRTRETWDHVRRALGGIGSETVPMIYEASPGRILDAVRSAPDAATSLLVIGHNPGFQDLALLLVGSGDATSRENLREKFPTAGLAVIDFAVARWDAVDRGGGRLERFVTPRDLAEVEAR